MRVLRQKEDLFFVVHRSFEETSAGLVHHIASGVCSRFAAPTIARLLPQGDNEASVKKEKEKADVILPAHTQEGKKNASAGVEGVTAAAAMTTAEKPVHRAAGGGPEARCPATEAAAPSAGAVAGYGSETVDCAPFGGDGGAPPAVAPPTDMEASAKTRPLLRKNHLVEPSSLTKDSESAAAKTEKTKAGPSRSRATGGLLATTAGNPSPPAADERVPPTATMVAPRAASGVDQKQKASSASPQQACEPSAEVPSAEAAQKVKMAGQLDQAAASKEAESRIESSTRAEGVVPVPTGEAGQKDQTASTPGVVAGIFGTPTSLEDHVSTDEDDSTSNFFTATPRQ